MARERPRSHRPRASALVAERRGGLRRVRPLHGRDGEIHQADPVHGTAGSRPTPSPRMAPGRASRPRLQRPLTGAAGCLHPAHDDERRRLPRPMVRDRSAQGDDQRLGDHRHVPGNPLSRDRLRPPAPLHGRDRRRPAGVGDTAGRNRRGQRGDRERSAVVRRRDPDRGPCRAHPDPRRRGHGRRHELGRGSDRSGDAVEPGPASDVRPARPARSPRCDRSSRTSTATNTEAPAER